MQFLSILAILGLLTLYSAHMMHHSHALLFSTAYTIQIEERNSLLRGLLEYAHAMIHEDKTLVSSILEDKKILKYPVQFWENTDNPFLGYITLQEVTNDTILVIAQLKEQHNIIDSKTMHIKIIANNKKWCTIPLIQPTNSAQREDI